MLTCWFGSTLRGTMLLSDLNQDGFQTWWSFRFRRFAIAVLYFGSPAAATRPRSTRSLAPSSQRRCPRSGAAPDLIAAFAGRQARRCNSSPMRVMAPTFDADTYPVPNLADAVWWAISSTATACQTWPSARRPVAARQAEVSTCFLALPTAACSNRSVPPPHKGAGGNLATLGRCRLRVLWRTPSAAATSTPTPATAMTCTSTAMPASTDGQLHRHGSSGNASAAGFPQMSQQNLRTIDSELRELPRSRRRQAFQECASRG